jgi:predicted glutamine amidotransferase
MSLAGHPWSLGCIMFMHNGDVAQFSKIKRKVQAFLSDRFFQLPLGNTDSEWCFALFLQHLSNLADVDANSFHYKVLQQAILNTIESINQWQAEAGVTEPSLLNFCVTDGQSIIATRYISSAKDEAASLWFSTGSVSRMNWKLSAFAELAKQSFEQYAPGGHYRMRKVDKRENIVVSLTDAGFKQFAAD